MPFSPPHTHTLPSCIRPSFFFLVTLVAVIFFPKYSGTDSFLYYYICSFFFFFCKCILSLRRFYPKHLTKKYGRDFEHSVQRKKKKKNKQQLVSFCKLAFGLLSCLFTLINQPFSNPFSSSDPILIFLCFNHPVYCIHIHCF